MDGLVKWLVYRVLRCEVYRSFHGNAQREAYKMAPGGWIEQPTT